MRFSSLVSLLVVTASFALGGCAADAEQTSGEATGQGESALIGSARAHQIVENKGIAQSAARGEEAARTRVVDPVTGQAVAFGRTGLNVGLGQSAEFTQTVEMEVDLAANIDKTGRADVIVDRAANPAQLVEVDPAFGARLPGSQQLSRAGEAHQETSTSGAKRVP